MSDLDINELLAGMQASGLRTIVITDEEIPMKVTRPTTENIRKAFNEYLTVDVQGFEQTAWDLMEWGGMETAIDFLQDYALIHESVGVHSDYEDMNMQRLEESIKEKAND
jgi:hypothetical protein